MAHYAVNHGPSYLVLQFLIRNEICEMHHMPSGNNHEKFIQTVQAVLKPCLVRFGTIVYEASEVA